MNMRASAELSSITIYPEIVRKLMCKLPNKLTRSPDGRAYTLPLNMYMVGSKPTILILQQMFIII